MRDRIKRVTGRIEKRLYRLGWLRRDGLCLPDFLGIGAQKSGTTWLWENLRCHPEIFLTTPKELHFFDWHFERSLRSYAGHFEPGVGKVKGEITPGYSILTPDRIDFVHWLVPDVRLMFLIRNPMERAWSQALMNLVKKPKVPFETVSEQTFIEHIDSPRSVQRGDYIEIVDNWLARFAEEQLLIEPFEAIRDEPRALLGRVLRHLGVDPEPDWRAFPVDEVIFRGVGVPPPPRIRDHLRRIYRDDLDRLAARFGAVVEPWRAW